MALIIFYSISQICFFVKMGISFSGFPIKEMIAEAYSKPRQTSMMELFRENSERLQAKYFHKKLPYRYSTGF